MDWRSWHDKYDTPDGRMARRLRLVQQQIWTALDNAPPGPLWVISLCAGQGRDLLGVLPDHKRRNDVRALLVELDETNTARAKDAARASGLDHVEILTAAAALTDHYRGMTPADLVLICGVFGSVSPRR